jgi:protein O-mannosyl-transferase
MSQKKLKKIRRQEKEQSGEYKKNETENVSIGEILKKNWKFLLVLCVFIIGIYFNSLKGDFVSDDYATIPQNPDILNFKSAVVTFAPGVSNWLVATMFGINSPIPFHIFSLVLYLITCVLVFVFCHLLFDKKTAIWIIILFAVLPINVEGVSWISGKPYLFNTLTVLLSLILFVIYFKTGIKKYLWTFIFSLLLAFLGERVRSLAIPLILPVLIFAFDKEFRLKINLGKVLALSVSGLFILGIFLWPMIQSRISNVNSGINASDSVFYNPFFQYPTAISKYLQLMLFPLDLTLYHTMYTIPIWLNWSILLVYLVALGWFFFKDKRMFFALSFIFLAAAPSMAPVKVSWLVAERYMLLGSVGFCIFIVLCFQKLEKRFKKLALVLFGFLVLAYSVRIFFRNIDWQTNHNLWVNTCQVSPNSHNAWNNIGDDYDKLAQLETTDEGKLRQYENAVKGFGQSYAIKPNYADAYHNQANIFYKMGRLDLARNAYETAISYNANMSQTLKTLVQLDLIEKNITELDNHLAKLQQLTPNDLEVAYITAVSYIQIGKIDQAKELVGRMYQQFPDIKEIKALYDSLMK